MDDSHVHFISGNYEIHTTSESTRRASDLISSARLCPIISCANFDSRRTVEYWFVVDPQNIAVCSGLPGKKWPGEAEERLSTRGIEGRLAKSPSMFAAERQKIAKDLEAVGGRALSNAEFFTARLYTGPSACLAPKGLAQRAYLA